MTAPDVQSGIINAAAKAGVPWILPNEWGQDGANAALADAVPLLKPKERYRREIEELGRSRWIGAANNPWFDFVRPSYLVARTEIFFNPQRSLIN